MPVYPRLYLNGQWVPSGDGKINLSDSSPVRQATVAAETFVPVVRGRRVLYPPDGIDFPLFSVKFLVMGQGSTVDDKIADCEQSIQNLTTLCCTRDINTMYYYPSQAWASTGLYAEGTLVSFEREESPRDYALITLIYRLNRPFWRAPNESSQTLAISSSSGTYTLSSDFNCSAPIFGPSLDILGPVTNPRIADFETGCGVLLNATIPSGVTVTISTEDMSGFGMANVTRQLSLYESSSSAGLATSARAFRLTNAPLTTGANPSDWRPRIRVNCTGQTSATRLTVRAYRQYR
jgi:hypothetical protein